MAFTFFFVYFLSLLLSLLLLSLLPSPFAFGDQDDSNQEKIQSKKQIGAKLQHSIEYRILVMLLLAISGVFYAFGTGHAIQTLVGAISGILAHVGLRGGTQGWVPHQPQPSGDKRIDVYLCQSQSGDRYKLTDITAYNDRPVFKKLRFQAEMLQTLTLADNQDLIVELLHHTPFPNPETALKDFYTAVSLQHRKVVVTYYHVPKFATMRQLWNPENQFALFIESVDFILLSLE